MPELFAPNEGEIQGTSETILAASQCTFDTDNPCGYDHTGGSEVFWDTSTTDSIDDVPLFTDDSGEDWLQHHLLPEGTEGMEASDQAELRAEIKLGRALEDAKRLAERGDQLSVVDRTQVNMIVADLWRRYRSAKQRSIKLVQAHIAAHPALEEEDA